LVLNLYTKMLGTEKEKNRSGTEKEKKRSGTEKEKNRPGTEKEKKRSGTEKGKKRKELTEAHTPPKETVKDEIVVCEVGSSKPPTPLLGFLFALFIYWYWFV